MPVPPTIRAPSGCPALVGRAEELRALVPLLESAAAGAGATVLIGGEAGVGKSRLARELKREAAARQMRVIEGRCSSTRASAAYGPFLDAIGFRLARGEQQAAAGTLAPILAYLTPLFPELGRGTAPASEVPVSQERAFEVIAMVFHRLAGLGPLLLVLEDLHWADPTSLELLQYLTRRIATVPILVLGTYRSDEMPARHGMRRLLVALSQERLGYQLSLKPLTRSDVAEMARLMTNRELSPAALDSLWERSQGNPFYVEELLGAAGTALEGGTGASPLPLTIRDAVRVRSEGLSPGAAEVLGIAAVIGRRFSYELLQAVSGRPSDELFAHLAELLDHQLLLEEAGPEEARYCFRHVLTQEVLYADIVVPRRRLWHARIAAALEARLEQSRPAYWEEIAHHYRLSGDAERARQWEVLAGDDAARMFAWTAAEAHYARALEGVDKGRAGIPLHASILDRLADVVGWQNRPDEALGFAERAVTLSLAAEPPEATAARLRRLALLVARHPGDRSRALAHLRAALSLLQDVPEGAEHARVMNDMGRLLAGEATAGTWLLRGLGVAQRHGVTAEIAFALAQLGRLAVGSGQVDEGVQRLRQARQLLREEDCPLERAASIYRAGMRALSNAGDRDAARQWLLAASAYASGHGLEADVALYRSYGSFLAEDAGLSEEVLEQTRSAVAILRRMRDPGLGDALEGLGELHRLRADLDAALACFTEALALGVQQAALGRGLALLAAGRFEEAWQGLQEALVAADPEHQLIVLRGLPILVEAYTLAGRYDAAAHALGRLETHSVRGDRVTRAAARHSAGELHAARGDRAAARQAYEDAVTGWTALGRVLDRARAELELGALLLGEDEGVERGAALIRTAVHELDRLGAALYARRGRALLQRRGLRAPPRRRVLAETLGHGLTPREMEVLRELAKGRTNKEIARVLDISERTAGVHVSHLLAKLRCTTRTQAVSYAIAQGLVHLTE